MLVTDHDNHGSMGDDERLDALFRAYRQACPDPEPSADFMPRLWLKIEARERVPLLNRGSDTHPINEFFREKDQRLRADGGIGQAERSQLHHMWRRAITHRLHLPTRTRDYLRKIVLMIDRTGKESEFQRIRVIGYTRTEDSFLPSAFDELDRGRCWYQCANVVRGQLRQLRHHLHCSGFCPQSSQRWRIFVAVGDGQSRVRKECRPIDSVRASWKPVTWKPGTGR